MPSNECVMKPEIRTHPNLEDLSRAAAEYICEIAEGAIKERGIFTFVLAGGSTPRLLYEELASQPIASRIDWQHTHLFWGDERFLPPDHPDSNFFLAFKSLISKVELPPANINRISTEIGSIQAAAEGYEKTLRKFFLPAVGSEEEPYFPSFDVVLLGLGEDGHTASLFPCDAALEEKTKWAVAVDGSTAAPSIPRVSLTLPVLNEARHVVFLASGASKRKVFREILNNPEKTGYPAARVEPSGRLLWFIDELLA
ncbi:MAG: 6-phosphogluconolactonase [Deltaproteobacteria bacterium]|nr:6-phosphogluconolactonase [Deltaproteobacteria bacterium]